MLDELVEIVVSKDVGRAITDHEIHATFVTSEDALNVVDGLLPRDVALDNRSAFNRSHLEKVDRNKVGLSQYIDTIFFKAFAPR